MFRDAAQKLGKLTISEPRLPGADEAPLRPPPADASPPLSRLSSMHPSDKFVFSPVAALLPAHTASASSPLLSEPHTPSPSAVLNNPFAQVFGRFADKCHNDSVGWALTHVGRGAAMRYVPPSKATTVVNLAIRGASIVSGDSLNKRPVDSSAGEGEVA